MGEIFPDRQTVESEVQEEQKVFEVFGGKAKAAQTLFDGIRNALNPNTDNHIIVIGETELSTAQDPEDFFAQLSEEQLLRFLFLKGIYLEDIMPIKWEECQKGFDSLYQKFVSEGAKVFGDVDETNMERLRIFSVHLILCMLVIKLLCPQKSQSTVNISNAEEVKRKLHDVLKLPLK